MNARRDTTRLQGPLPWTWLVWLLPLFAWAPLASPGYFELYSGYLPIFNLNDLGRHLFDPAWMPAMAQPHDWLRGEGAFPYRLAMLLHLTGMSPVVAIRSIFGLSLLLGAVGMFAWTRRRLGPWPALLASIVYVYFPVLLATIYVRGAFAEAVLLALMPWVLWAADSSAEGSRPAAAGLALGTALLFWTQAGAALWMAAVVGARLLWRGWPRASWRAGTRRAPLVAWLIGAALGLLGLLPAILAHGGQVATYVNFVDHFVQPHQLLLAGWGTANGSAGPDGSRPFSFGAMSFGLAVLGLLRCDRRPRAGDQAQDVVPAQGWFALAVVLVFATLSTPLAAPLWRWLPFLSRPLTYPWQLLLLVCPWLAWLSGAGGRGLLARWPAEERWERPLQAGLLTLVLLGSYGDLNPMPAGEPISDAPVAIFGRGEIALLDAAVQGTPGPGGRIAVEVTWQALRPLEEDYTVFFHAIDPDGRRWGQQDTMPQAGRLPTSQWRPGQVIRDRYELTLAADAPVGARYRYLLGWYRWQTGERLMAGADDKVVLMP